MSNAPLADVRVLAIEQYGAGPWGTMQLSDLGADVIKIEDPASGGDVSRYVPPYQDGESSLFFESFNRGKKSISLDLRNVDARMVLEDLVRRSDAVFSNLRGDQPDRLRLRYDDLRGVNPRIVCCSLSGFGMSGPRASEGAYDYTLQGLAGWQSVTGDPDGPPTKSGLSLVDFCGGYVAALGLLAAIWRARREGRGADVDLSLFEVALAQLTYLGTWVASRGYEPVRRRNSAHQSVVPFQNFATADGWVVVACPKQTLWEKLCGALDRPDLVGADGSYATFADRDANRVELLQELETEFATRPTEEWLETLTAAGVPCAPVNAIAEAIQDPQAAARGAIVEHDHPVLGRVRAVGSPFVIDGARPQPRSGPGRGVDTRSLLREVCGYSDERIGQLGRRGAFGAASVETEVTA
jgi:crotonobetainyl-CoA:carnitine CoA-transferase CaiB-like acyl-CoA transferase